ncbi:putative amidoligase domain-containing protein [Paenibacillus cymbidii]|uniref:putative amidoligase domain-containing protein n=1 Tax=Paenibacillus cymbidii TaxID=1639034 RepID=UPI001080EEDB|nr:hypothetical protein [Paenibacillus cymbidii]
MDVYLLHAGEPDAVKLADMLAVKHGRSLPQGEAPETVIRWGVIAPEPGEGHVMNPLAAALRCMRRASRNELLALHGLKPAPPPDRQPAGFAHEFFVPVFHLQALALYERERPSSLVLVGPTRHPGRFAERMEFPLRHDGGALPVAFAEADSAEAEGEKLGFHGKRAVREAVKALYALGLDYGLVRIGVTPEGRTCVADVLPFPRLTKRLTALFAEAIGFYASELAEDRRRGSRALRLGADPEFVLMRGGKVAFASRYLDKEGEAGWDNVMLPGRQTITPLAELRPEPSPDPRELLRGIRRAMRIAAERIGDPRIRWLAGGMPVRGLPIGGHVHISGITLSSRLLRLLDNYTALPLVLLEGAGAGRRRPKYGFLGDFRRQPHGGFEYRTLPSWLADPELALGVLALVRVVAAHRRELGKRPLAHPDVQRAYYAGDKAALLPHARELWRDLEATGEYAAYADALEPLKARVLGMQALDESEDIRVKWGMDGVPAGRRRG